MGGRSGRTLPVAMLISVHLIAIQSISAGSGLISASQEHLAEFGMSISIRRDRPAPGGGLKQRVDSTR